MKNRKVLAFVMALAMIFTLIPASAFAGSSNEVDRVTSVSANSDIPDVTLTLMADRDFTVTEQSIRLTLSNAEWAMSSDNIRLTPDAIFTNVASVTTGSAGPSINIAISTGSTITAKAISITSETAEFTISTSALIKKDDIVTLTLALKAGSENGEVKVAVDRLASQFSSSVHTVATVGSGKTSATVIGTPRSTWRVDSFQGNAIEIRENAVNSVTSAQQILKLTLPSGYEWNNSTSIGGNMASTHSAVVQSDKRDIIVTLTPVGSPTSYEVLTITPDIKVTKDAKIGEITVSVRNQSSSGNISNASGLVVGMYAEESVNVTTVPEADLPEIIAGRVDTDYEVEVRVEEAIYSALASERYIDFELPTGVQLATWSAVKFEQTGTATSNGSIVTGDGNDDYSGFEYQLPTGLNSTTKDKFVFTIPVTVSANAGTQDLVIKVSGAKAGLADTELVVAKILAPVTVDVKVADVRAGIQKQALGEITIKENFAGAIQEGFLDINISNAIYGSLTAAEAEVISGDLEIKKDGVTRPGTEPIRTIRIEIDRESVKTPAEIKISNVAFSIDRTPAEGKYKVQVGGVALVENSHYYDFTGYVVEEDYLNVITLADANLYGQAKFVIGEAKYEVYVNGVLETNDMDTAPYIDTANRTQVPVRFAANALGVSDDNIIWDQASKSVTIFKGDRVIVFTVGSNKINVNGATINMDTTMVNNNGRTFVPIAHLSNALGATYVWDATEKSVTITRATN